MTHAAAAAAAPPNRAQRPLSNEISPRCGSSEYADRAERAQRRSAPPSRRRGLPVDPPGPTSPGQAAPHPSHQDVDRAHGTLAAPGLFTASDVRTGEHRGRSPTAFILLNRLPLDLILLIFNKYVFSNGSSGYISPAYLSKRVKF